MRWILWIVAGLAVVVLIVVVVGAMLPKAHIGVADGAGRHAARRVVRVARPTWIAISPGGPT